MNTPGMISVSPKPVGAFIGVNMNNNHLTGKVKYTFGDNVKEYNFTYNLAENEKNEIKLKPENEKKSVILNKIQNEIDKLAKIHFNIATNIDANPVAAQNVGLDNNFSLNANLQNHAITHVNSKSEEIASNTLIEKLRAIEINSPTKNHTLSKTINKINKYVNVGIPPLDKDMLAHKTKASYVATDKTETTPVSASTPPFLKNIDNSCYMDASLQLFWLARDKYRPKITKLLDEYKKTPTVDAKIRDKIAVLQALEQFYKACDEGKSNNIQKALQDLRNSIFKEKPIHPEFELKNIKAQMDAEAFISLLMEFLEENSLTVKEITDFGVQENNQYILKLNLEQPKNQSIAIQELINSNFSSESVVLDNIKTQKKTILVIQPKSQAPDYVFVQILRHGKDNKVKTKVIFPDNHRLKLPFNISKKDKPSELQNEPVEYEIIGVQNHHGDSMNSGHYTADIKDPTNNKWIHCDDMPPKNAEVPSNFKEDQENCYFLLLKKVS